MCLALAAFDHAPGWPLILLANRDERRGRPAVALDWWDERPDIVGGRDAVAGGSWLAVHRDGRFATVLNDPDVAPPAGAPSRGGLVTAALDAPDPEVAVRELHARRSAYAGFHLLVGRPGSGCYCGSRSDGPRTLAAGVHAVGNAGLDPAAPRLRHARGLLAAELAAGVALDGLLALLADTADPGPGTGDTRPVFVAGPEFGTRCSTVFMVADDGSAYLHERRFDAKARTEGDSARRWRIAPGHERP